MAIERIEPGTQGWEAFYGNHINRYQFAVEYIRTTGKPAPDILDAACGVGYGSHFLATELRAAVTGVDLNDDALTIANIRFTHPNVQFIKDNVELFATFEQDGIFDFIVSFETLEHLKHPEKFLAQCRRLLKKEGELIFSTPNVNVTGLDGERDWEYHEKEYTAEELAELIESAQLKGRQFFGQQLTEIGQLKAEIRGELNRISLNPLVRLGFFLQKHLRRRAIPKVILPESSKDFLISPYEKPQDIDDMGKNGPFVIVAVARRQ